MILCAPVYYSNCVQAGDTFTAHVASSRYTFEARVIEEGNEYSFGKSLEKAGIMTGAVAAGTASVVLGSFWALGTFGGHFTPPGQAALATSGGLMTAAHAAGAAYAEPKGGVVMTKHEWVGFENILRFSIRVKDGLHELVRL